VIDSTTLLKNQSPFVSRKNVAGNVLKNGAANSTQTEHVVNARENLLAFISNASPEEADKRLNSYKEAGNFSLGPVVNLNEIMAAEAAGNSDVAERIHRLSDKFHEEQKLLHRQEVDLINLGKADGKSSKEILTELVGLYDKQSDFFKLSIGWNGKFLSTPESYSKLLELTQGYVNAYA
jgi:hypothetical protein